MSVVLEQPATAALQGQDPRERQEGSSVNGDAGAGKRKSMTLSILPPIIRPLLHGAGKLRDGTQSGLVWTAKQFASDGGGVRISNHWGIAAENAARAWWGNGPLKNEGRGIAGGNSKLEMAGTIVGGSAVLAVIAAPGGVDLLELRRTKPAPVASLCEHCRCGIAAAPGGSDTAAPAVCPHCGRGKTSTDTAKAWSRRSDPQETVS